MVSRLVITSLLVGCSTWATAHHWHDPVSVLLYGMLLGVTLAGLIVTLALRKR
jgi:hypothetical protein